MAISSSAFRTMLFLVGGTLTGTASLPSIAMAAEAPIKIAVEAKFPPFNYLDSNNQFQGFDVEIAKALCETMKAKCEFVEQQWEGMIPGLLADRYDAIISSMSMSAERREKVDFTKRYYDSPSNFIAPKGSPISATKPDDLKGIRIGVTLSTAQEAYAKHFYSTAYITVFGSSPELYKGLTDGSVDIILEDKLAIYDWLTNTRAGSCCEFKGDEIKDPTYFGDGAGIAIRKQDADLRSKLDAALKEIQTNGSYDMINAKYFPFSIK